MSDVSVNVKSIDQEDANTDEQMLLSKCLNSLYWKIIVVACLVSLIIACIIAVTMLQSQAEPASDAVDFQFTVSSSPLGVYRFASVSANAGRCSQIGTRILAQGGTAVDAAIAACLCTSVFNIHNAGIGGGFFMTIWDQKSQKAYVVDARETAPAFATEDMYVKENISSTVGPHSIAIPGELAGYWEAHARFGRLPWKDLFQPTIDLCNNGIEVTKVLANAIILTFRKLTRTKDQTPFMALKKFLTNQTTGFPLKTGDIMKCSVLAKTLSRVAKLGAVAFYNGEIADDIISDLQEIGSRITKSDLSSYRVAWRTPVEMNVQNRWRLVSMPPPGSGAILGFILNILAGYNLTSTDKRDLLSYHRFTEASKFAYAKRMEMGDESFVTEMSDLLANLTSPLYGEYVRSLISDTQTHPTSFYLTNTASEIHDQGTSHISVVDAAGNAVSMTSTINLYFGSGVFGKRTGIIFNDEMDDFSSPNTPNYFDLPPSPANFIRPGKRPQSSMCPAIFLTKNSDSESDDYRVALAVGAAGGSRITSGTAYVSMRILWFNENPKQAIDAPRIHHQLIPETLYYESNMPPAILNYLRKLGHVNQTDRGRIMSAVQAIQVVKEGTILANADMRKDAFSDGF